jgi:ABC-type nickel/cobalt efflux system permease component RcnA
MHPWIGSDWHKTLWKIVRNPTFEVIVAIIVVALAAWLVVQTEIDLRHNADHGPLLFAK